MKVISTKKAPAAVGPYSQAVVTGDFIFCSGQIGLDPKTGELKKNLEEQTEQIFKNIKAVLEEEFCDLNNIIKTTVFLTDMKNFKKMNEIYEKNFKNHKPARSTIGVKELPKDAVVEIEVTAIR
jgi:2-iminobutanoate/2-iminopropanoate deaminase